MGRGPTRLISPRSTLINCGSSSRLFFFFFSFLFSLWAMCVCVCVARPGASKIDKDPRVTKVGRFLRKYQPRRASAVVQRAARRDEPRGSAAPRHRRGRTRYGGDFAQRLLVLPGITGLWQVEARDNPSLRGYRRLDLFYVENWSIVLDLMILMGTVEQLAAKIVMMVVRSVRRSPDRQEAHVVSRV